MRSLIQLKDHRILRVNFDTRQIEGQPSELEFGHAIEVFCAEGNPQMWLVRLDVQFKPCGESSSSPYLGEIAVVGTFELDADFPKEKANDMVHMNGGSVLYSMAREILSNISSRGVHGLVTLPTIDARSFIPTESKQKDEVEMGPSVRKS